MIKWLQAKARKLLGVSEVQGPPGPMGPTGMRGKDVFVTTEEGREVKATYHNDQLILWVDGSEYAFLPNRLELAQKAAQYGDKS